MSAPYDLSLVGGPVELISYVFAAVTSTVALTGFYTDARGDQIGNLVTYSIPTAAASKFSTMAAAAGGTVPSNGVGFDGCISGAVYYGKNGKQTSPEVPAAGYPQFIPDSTQANHIQIGRIKP